MKRMRAPNFERWVATHFVKQSIARRRDVLVPIRCFWSDLSNDVYAPVIPTLVRAPWQSNSSLAVESFWPRCTRRTCPLMSLFNQTLGLLLIHTLQLQTGFFNKNQFQFLTGGTDTIQYQVAPHPHSRMLTHTSLLWFQKQEEKQLLTMQRSVTLQSQIQ